MGSVYERSKGNWWIQWREDGSRRWAHGFATRELAERVRDKIIADIAAGRAGLPIDPTGVPTISDLAETWLKRRHVTHRAASDDQNRWKKHLKPFFGNCRPAEVNAASIRRFVEAKLASGLSSTTVGHCVRLLSTFFSDLVEQGYAEANPVGTVPRATRRLYRPAHDPQMTPFLEKLDDVRRVFLALPVPFNVAFAIGALGGLRTGEVLALNWRDVDLDTRRIRVHEQVRDSRLAPLKDDESRFVPIAKALDPILREHHLRTGGVGLLFPPSVPTRGGRLGRAPAFMRPNTLWRHLHEALLTCGLPRSTWYQATRHTFASQWILAGGSIEKLAKVMGHSSVVVTERYARLKPDFFREADYSLLDVDLTPGGRILPFSPKTGTISYAVATQSATDDFLGSQDIDNTEQAPVAQRIERRFPKP